MLDPAGERALARQMFDHVRATLREAGVIARRVADGDRDLNADVAAAARRVQDGARRIRR